MVDVAGGQGTVDQHPTNIHNLHFLISADTVTPVTFSAPRLHALTLLVERRDNGDVSCFDTAVTVQTEWEYLCETFTDAEAESEYKMRKQREDRRRAELGLDSPVPGRQMWGSTG